MTAWSCAHDEAGICRKVAGACCRPGMRGCVLVGKVQFPDGVVPAPVWPEGQGPAGRAPAGPLDEEGGEG